MARKLKIVNTELGDLGIWGKVSHEKQLLFIWPLALLDIFLLKYNLLPSVRENSKSSSVCTRDIKMTAKRQHHLKTKLFLIGVNLMKT